MVRKKQDNNLFRYVFGSLLQMLDTEPLLSESLQNFIGVN